MPKIIIDVDEIFPAFTIIPEYDPEFDDFDESRWPRFDISQEEYEEFQEVFKRFWDVQERLKSLSKRSNVP